MELEKHLKENWSKYFPGLDLPKKIELILVKSYKKNSLFVFDQKSKFPLCIVRVATQLTGERLKRNFLAIKALESLALPMLDNAYSRPFFYGTMSGHEVMIQSFVKGQRMGKAVKSNSNLFWRRNFAHNINLVNDWLIRFHQITKQEGKELDSALLGKIQNQLEILEIIETKQIFSVFQHGDLHMDNILIQDGKSLAILDWDLSDKRGFPLWDLLDFILYYCRLIKGGRRKGKELVDYLETAFFESNNFSNIAAKSIGKYLQAMALDMKDLTLLFLLWIEKRFADDQILRYVVNNYQQFPVTLYAKNISN